MTTPATPFDDGELYDVLFHDLTYGIDFYVDLARRARGPILDVACGTGRVLLPCLQAGADGDGLDLAEPMLATLRQKAAALGLKPNVVAGDMADFRMPRKYAMVMIAFNAIVHNLTQESQLRTLERCREHLLPGGLLVFDTYFPALGIIGAAEGTRVLELESKHPITGQAFRCYDTRKFDRVEQVQHSINEMEFLDAAGNIEVVHRSEFSVRWIYKAEMALLLRTAGFARWEICGDFDRRPLTQETDAQIVFAWPDAVGE